MNEICSFAIDRRWPALHPDRLQLYSSASPAGLSVSIMLKETGLPYEFHDIIVGADGQRPTEFLELSPEGRIPAIIDPDGPDDAPIHLCDPGAILLYLAEKTGKLMPAALSDCYQAIQWAFFPASASRSHMATAHRAENTSAMECGQWLGIIEARLRGRDWIVDSGYSIADIALLGWLQQFAGELDVLEFSRTLGQHRVAGWLQRCLQRPAVQRGFHALQPQQAESPAERKPARRAPAF